MLFDDCWKRTRELTGWKTQTQLAEFLGIKTGPVSDAKRRRSFPLEWAFKIAQRYGATTDWIITGKTLDRNVEQKGLVTGVEVREKEVGFSKKDRILLLQTKLKHIMDHGNHGQQTTVARTVEDIYDEVFQETE